MHQGKTEKVSVIQNSVFYFCQGGAANCTFFFYDTASAKAFAAIVI
jgi:hypothetical protein